ncbi:MAG: hypothetical protein R3E50_07585 [Halioglobus sp.]
MDTTAATTCATPVVAERLIHDLELNIHVYSPEMTSERRNTCYGGIPTVDEEERHRNLPGR